MVASVTGKSLTSNVVKLTQGAVTPPTISIQTTAGVTKISYTGTLQSSGTVGSGYIDVPGASSPYTVDTTTGSKFFRSRN